MGLVGDREVRRPGHRERAPLGAEDHELEAVAVAGRAVAQVAGVVPPLGQPIVRGVVAREDDRLRIGRRAASRTGPTDGAGMAAVRVGEDRSAGRARGEAEGTGEEQPEERRSPPAHRTATSTSASDRGSRLARRRSSRAGIHQFHRPSSRIVAGTSRARTTVASRATAIAMPTPERLDEDDVGEGERAGHDDDDESGRGHDPPAPLEAAGDRLGVVAGPVPGLLHPGQEEDLVVHREAEQDAEEDDRLGRLDEAEGLEAEEGREVALLEDPDQGPEAGADRKGVHDERLGRQDRRAEEDEEDEVRRHDDEQARAREFRGHLGDDVLRRRPPRRRRGRSCRAAGASGPLDARRSRTSDCPSGAFGPYGV